MIKDQLENPQLRQQQCQSISVLHLVWIAMMERKVEEGRVGWGRKEEERRVSLHFPFKSLQHWKDMVF